MIHATNLRAEFRADPEGIDERRPRLSWTVESDRRAELQSGCRIQVATSEALLEAGTPDLWDSGELPGDESAHHRYAGAALRSHQRCFWRVRLRDRDGAAGRWSEPARWSMGILEPAGWAAEWIGLDAPREEVGDFPRAPAQWIWGPEDARRVALCHLVDLPETVVDARLAVAAKARFRLWVNGREAARSREGPEAWKHPVLVEDASIFRPGRNVLYAEAEGEDSAGFALWLVLSHPDDGRTVVASTPAWRATGAPMPEWRASGAGPDGGTPARTLGMFGAPPWRLLDESTLRLPPARYLKGTCPVSRRPVRAVLYAAALGAADFYLNGARVSDDRFAGWTDYRRRVYYRAYDVTAHIRQGANVLGVVLADGWYSGYVGWGALREHYGRNPRALAQLHLEFEDGSTEEFGTSGSWLGGTGAVREADLLMGERHDARLPHAEFFLDAAAPAARVDAGAPLAPQLAAHPGPPVRAWAELTPVAITEPRPGVWVVDFGRNFAGVVRLRVTEPAGQEITLRFAERLATDGTLYTENLRGARAIDRFVASGRGQEIWEPRFTFHGFQYVELTGLTGRPDTGTLTGVALSSATPEAGEFECSVPMLNRLVGNIRWTQRANFIEVPTDCPQRDERLGWTGDAQVYAPSACLTVDAQAFFHKWMRDLNDAQREDGQFPEVAPHVAAGGDGGPAWSDAGVIVPWTVYEIYGDTSILEECYEHMARFVEFCAGRSPQLLPPERFHCFGDWLNIQAETPKEVIATAYLARSAGLLARAAAVLGRDRDAARYRELARNVRAAFRRAYVGPDGAVHGDTQTAYALALSFALLDEPEAQGAARRLLADLERRGWRLSTGFVGTKELMLALSAIGRDDIGHRLLLGEEFPSWGFTIRHGATSIWERWDGWTPERGFQDPQMNSFAHYAFGAVYEWMVARIGGIRATEPGFRRLEIAPAMELDSARVVYRSVRGLIRSEWRRRDGRFTLEVEIPASCRCTVKLPAASVTESGLPAEKAGGVLSVRPGAGGLEVTVGSGSYRFEGDAR